MIDPSMGEQFGEQLTILSLELGVDQPFSEVRRDSNNNVVSRVSWRTCQHDSDPPCGFAKEYSCCERFADKSKPDRPCGLFGSDSALLFDRYLSYVNNGVGLVAGIGLKYNTSGVRVTAEEFGLAALPGSTVKQERNLCFLMDVMCAPLTPYFQVPNIDAVYSGEDICLRARISSQHGCVASTGKFLQMTSWKVLFMLLAPFAMFSGVLLAVFGWRLFRVTALVLGLFFGLSVAGVVIVFSVFLACEANKPTWTTVDFWTWSHECTFHYLTSNR